MTDKVSGPLFGRLLRLPTRTAITPKYPDKKTRVITPGCSSPSAPGSEGFQRIGEESVDVLVPKIQDSSIRSSGGDELVETRSGDTFRMVELDQNPLSRTHMQRHRFPESV